jgi:tetratricopeptide (TPR) repeat protein
MSATQNTSETSQLTQTIEMFEVIAQSQPMDYQSLEILKEAYSKLGRQSEVIGTSKRIANAYVLLGQYSSAILEYETVLQFAPNDPDVKQALQDIELKANNFSTQTFTRDTSAASKTANSLGTATPTKSSPKEVDDGRREMHRVFVTGKLISAGDFELCWPSPDLKTPPTGVIEPFIQILADKGTMLPEKCLKVLADESRLAYLPMDKYDIDMELTRSFPADVCRRWCVLPFDRMSKTLMVATANPFNVQAFKDLTEVSPGRVQWYLTPPADIIAYLRKAFRSNT